VQILSTRQSRSRTVAQGSGTAVSRCRISWRALERTPREIVLRRGPQPAGNLQYSSGPPPVPEDSRATAAPGTCRAGEGRSRHSCADLVPARRSGPTTLLRGARRPRGGSGNRRRRHLRRLGGRSLVRPPHASDVHRRPAGRARRTAPRPQLSLEATPVTLEVAAAFQRILAKRSVIRGTASSAPPRWRWICLWSPAIGRSPSSTWSRRSGSSAGPVQAEVAPRGAPAVASARSSGPMDVPERLVGSALVGWASRPRGVEISMVVCWPQTPRPPTTAATPAAAGRGRVGRRPIPQGRVAPFRRPTRPAS
jgi:hypothetical protein